MSENENLASHAERTKRRTRDNPKRYRASWTTADGTSIRVPIGWSGPPLVGPDLLDELERMSAEKDNTPANKGELPSES